MTFDESSHTGKKDGGKAGAVSSGGHVAPQAGKRGVRPVHEVVALSNKLFFQTAIVRYGSWERFLEKNGAPAEDEDQK